MKYFIYGITDLGENLLYLLDEDGVEPAGFILDADYRTADRVRIDFGKGEREYPIYAFESLEEHFAKEEIAIFVCIGYTQMNAARRRKFEEIRSKGYSLPNFISSKACVEAAEIGEGNLFFEDSYAGMYDCIGDGNIFYARSMVAHHSKVGDFNFFAISSSIAAHVRIGNENFFGNNSLTKDKIEIGDRNLIGAGAYLPKMIGNDIVLAPGRSVVLDGKKGTDFL